MRKIRVKGTRSEVTVEVDGVRVICHPIGKNFEYEVTRQDIEMLTERAMAQAEEDEEAKADADASVEAASVNFDDAPDPEDSDEYADEGGHARNPDGTPYIYGESGEGGADQRR